MNKEEKKKKKQIRELIASGMTANDACKQVKYSLQKWYLRPKGVQAKAVRRSRPVAIQELAPAMRAHIDRFARPVSLITGTPAQIAEILRSLQ